VYLTRTEKYIAVSEAGKEASSTLIVKMVKDQQQYSTADKIQDKRICNNCIGESFLSELVKKNGQRRKCSYCKVTGKTISVKELVDRTERVVEQFYQRTSEDPDNYQSALLADKESDYFWVREGDLITDVIEDVAKIPREAAEDIQGILQDRFFDRSAEEIGEETEFDQDSMYEYVGVGSKAWEEKWSEFENSLKANARFFNQLGKEYLDDIFKDINQLKMTQGNPIMFVGPDHSLKSAYRARAFLSDESLRNGLSNFVDNLGPPAPQFAKAGRMNAAGISVFYGATDDHTALAEVRPPVGSKVAVAKFTFMRDLKLLNLLELKNIRVDGSLFDEAHADLLSRVQFLNQLCEKMTIPVMPGDEDTEYLVTQAIADYLSMDNTVNLDGIVFPSIQTKKGSNIVLFHKASKVEQRTVPTGTEISVTLCEYDDDGPYPWFTVWEETPRGDLQEPPPKVDSDPRLPSLAIADQDIKIHLIEGVHYTSDPHDLYIRRHEKVDYQVMKKRLDW
jgi:hypothetical protein